MRDPSPRDRERAEALATQVRQTQGGQRRTWRKVTTLLDHFGVSKLTPAARVRIGTALRAAGLEVEPPLTEALRTGTVILTPVPEAGASKVKPSRGRADTHEAGSNKAISASFWSPHSVRKGELDLRRQPEEVAWYDIDIRKGDEKAVWSCLKPHCRGLTEDMVSDLFKVDDHPGVETKFEDEEEVRVVTSVAVRPWPIDQKRLGVDLPKTAEDWEVRLPEDAEERLELAFWIVELLAGDEWLISAWHPGQIQPSQNPGVVGPKPMSMHMFLPALTIEWRVKNLKNAHDLGTLLLQRLALGYADAHRSVFQDLSRVPQEQLPELRELANYFRGQIIELDRQDWPPGDAWFKTTGAAEQARSTNSLLKAAREELAQVDDAISGRSADLERRSADLERRSAESERQRAQSAQESFQTLLAAAGGIVLVPTLIASIFGANTALPGEHRWLGFAIMAALMLVSVIATAWVLHRLYGRQRGTKSEGAARSYR